MKILVAGGSGFIGKHFLLHAPATCTCWGTWCTANKFPDFLQNHGLDHVLPIQVDLSSSADVQRMIQTIGNRFDACLYVMGNSDIGLSRRQPLADVQANLHPLLNLLSRIEVGKFVFMSSGSVYEGHCGPVHPAVAVAPTIPYSVDKLASELFIRYYQHHTDHIEQYVNIRFFGAYGPMEPSRKIYTNLIRQFAMEKQATYRLIGNGKNYIDAMYIDDAVTALWKIIFSDKGNLTVDLCYGHPMTINELVLAAGKLFELDVQITHEGDPAEYTTFYASPDETAALFGFRPTISFEDGMTRFARYLTGKSHPQGSC